MVERLDGLVLTVVPTWTPSTITKRLTPISVHSNPSVDAWEIALLAAARKKDLPILAICRGLQLVNWSLEERFANTSSLTAGRTPTVDVDGHEATHSVNVVEARSRPNSSLARLGSTRCTIRWWKRWGGSHRLGEGL